MMRFPAPPTSLDPLAAHGVPMGQTRLLERPAEPISVLRSTSDRVGQYVLTLMRQDDPSPAQRAAVPPAADMGTVRARIGWGLGGFYEQIECDWLHGTLIALPSSSVSVEAIGDLNPMQTAGAVIWWNQRIGATLGLGSRPGGVGSMPLARLTQYLTAAEVTAIAYRDVPRRAHALRVCTNDQAGPGNITVRQLATEAASAHAREEANIFSRPAGPEPLVLGAATRSVEIRNEAATPQQVTLIWDLAL